VDAAMNNRTCPLCHQHYAVERFGVRLTPLKARIVDYIKASGDLGASTQELRHELYGPRTRRLAATIRVHIYQINDQLEETNWIIRSEADLALPRWYLRRRRIRRAA
jgi:DNA-binding response OmpR family regulator